SRVIDARQLVCPLWLGIEHLRAAMASAWAPESGLEAIHAVSMTGELCDNFESRDEGVSEILAVVAQVLGSERTRIYAGEQGWRSIEQAMALGSEFVASANWRATAEAVALVHDDAVLVDVGSTTTDIIPIVSGALATRGTDDATRLSHDELVYTGVVRTPLMALCDTVPFAGRWQRIAAEHFAATADIYRILGQLPEDADLHETADGGPKTVVASARRVCRMLGRDFVDDKDAVRGVSDYFAYRQFEQLQRALLGVQSRLSRKIETIVAAGAGSFVAQKLARFNGVHCVDFPSLFEGAPGDRHAVSTCAPAAALAKLAWLDR
ncbi:MAG TPA: hydantoinase/oxoprolinase family protein, partial [Gammaproteobacteria bacterium]|nr:hydantoinase/oxoprolinase family protein [Gammaproteobacteria bacterium]